MANVTPTETAKADTTDKYFEMSYGAQVSLSKKYSGIRFTAVVSDSWYAEQTQNGATVEFGMLIAPYTGAELVYENAEALGASVIVNQTEVVFDENGEYTYTGAIRYDDILADYREAYPTSTATDEQILASAYKMELSARAYAIVTAEDGTKGEPVYATSNNNVRSARQVANSALLKGDIQKNLSSGLYTEDDIPMLEARLNGYIVGTKERSNVSVDYDLSVSEAQTVDFAGLKGEIEEVLIDGQKVDATVNGTKVTLNAISGFSAGEHYLSAFDKDGNVYSQKIILATKIIKTASELASLQSYVDVTTGEVQINNGGTKATYYGYGGYFVLGGNITGDGTQTFSANTIGHIDTSKFLTGDIGFHGTFDGRGYTVDNFKYGVGGVFGDLGNGAVIKNVAFTNCAVGAASGDKGMAVLSSNAKGAWTVENVYAQGTLQGNNMGMFMGRSAGDGVMTDTVIKMKEVGTGWTNGAITSIGGTIQFTNVVVVYDKDCRLAQSKVYSDGKMINGVNEYVEQTNGTVNKVTAKSETNPVTSITATTVATAADFEDYDSKYWTVVDGYAPVYNQYTEDGKKIVDLTAYKTVDLVVKDTTATVGEQIATGVNGLVGAISVNAVYENNTTTDVKDNVGSVAGFLQTADTATTEAARTKTMLVYTADTVYKVKAVVITKVIMTAKELADLRTYANNVQSIQTDSGNHKADSYDGYFVLGGNLTQDNADKVTFKAPAITTTAGVVNGNLNNIKYFTDMNGKAGTIGFHGTFDGRGYKIDGFTYGVGGVFGLLGSGATIKNVAFTNCVMESNITNNGILAQGAHGTSSANWKIDNVYVQGTVQGNNCGMLIATRTDYGKISNSVFEMKTTAGYKIGAVASGAGCNFDNVAIIYDDSGARTNKDFVVFVGKVTDTYTGLTEYALQDDGTAQKITAKTGDGTHVTSITLSGTAATAADFANFDSKYWTVTAGYAPVFKTK